VEELQVLQIIKEINFLIIFHFLKDFLVDIIDCLKTKHKLKTTDKFLEYVYSKLGEISSNQNIKDDLYIKLLNIVDLYIEEKQLINIFAFKKNENLVNIIVKTLIFAPSQLEEIMFQALKFNKPTFVQLLIDNDFDVDTFLTDQRHMELYKNILDFNELPFVNYLKIKFNINIENIDYEENNYITKFFELSKIKYGLFLSKLDRLTISLIKIKNTRPPQIIHLFIWSILYNKPAISKIFLLKIRDQVNFEM